VIAKNQNSMVLFVEEFKNWQIMTIDHIR